MAAGPREMTLLWACVRFFKDGIAASACKNLMKSG